MTKTTDLNIEYWPGTGIVKSTDNDFNWQKDESEFFNVLFDHIKKTRSWRPDGVGKTTKGQPYYMEPLEKIYQKSLFTDRKKRKKI